MPLGFAKLKLWLPTTTILFISLPNCLSNGLVQCIDPSINGLNFKLCGHNCIIGVHNGSLQIRPPLFEHLLLVIGCIELCVAVSFLLSSFTWSCFTLILLRKRDSGLRTGITMELLRWSAATGNMVRFASRNPSAYEIKCVFLLLDHCAVTRGGDPVIQ